VEDEECKSEQSPHHDGYDDDEDDAVASLSKRLVRSKRKKLSYQDLQRNKTLFDDDVRHLFEHIKDDQKLRKQIMAFTPPPQQERDLASFTCDRALLLRERILHSGRFLALVTVLWLAADVDGTNTMTREKYLLLNQKLQICVLGRHDPGFCDELAARDWELDKGERGSVPFATIVNSMFLLADMYVSELTEDAYCDFLSSIAQRVVRIDPMAKASLVFRDDARVISRKTFQFIQSERPSWAAFPLPADVSECRRMFGTSVWQTENMQPLGEHSESKE
jgi:hypothetical protein